MIEFIDEDTGDRIGTLVVEDGARVATGIALSLIDTRAKQDMENDELLAYYDSWSNGYVTSRRV